MPQSLVKILIHMVWSTKDRLRLIPPEFEARLFGYIGGIIANNGGRMIIAGEDADHIHLLSSTGRVAIPHMIGDIERDSSNWIKKQDLRFAEFYWQRGYGAFSIGQSQVADVSRYIRDQKEHHRSQTYQDEFRLLCRKYDVEIDERYCWD